MEVGLILFIFSTNVPLEVELDSKQLARAHGILVVGWDCGASILSGAGIGFANAVRRGPIGAVGPSGTGLQEFTCREHQAGSGVSHAIDTGGHGLSDETGGITTWMAIEVLESDPRTQLIALTTKPAGLAAA